MTSEPEFFPGSMGNPKRLSAAGSAPLAREQFQVANNNGKTITAKVRIIDLVSDYRGTVRVSDFRFEISALICGFREEVVAVLMPTNRETHGSRSPSR